MKKKITIIIGLSIFLWLIALSSFVNASSSSITIEASPNQKNFSKPVPITFTAKSTLPNAEYNFFINDFDRDNWTWRTVPGSGWGDNTFTWTPPANGRYDIVVWVKQPEDDPGNHKEWRGFSWKSITVGALSSAIAKTNPNVSYIGGVVTVTVESIGVDDPVYYFAFNEDYSQGEWYHNSGWTNFPTYSWNLSRKSGQHLIAVWVKERSADRHDYREWSAYDQTSIFIEEDDLHGDLRIINIF